jgi:CHASE2 domain-containing sensor protein
MRIQEEKICLCQAIALKKRKKSDCSPKHFIDLLGLVNLYTIPSQPTSPLFMLQTKFYYEYQVGGSLENDAPSYVTRSADATFYRALKAGQFCYVLNSRQMGKSSLRVRIMEKLQAEGTVCAFIDLTGIGKQDLTAEKWYAGIVQSLVSSCQLAPKIQWRTWWRERQDLLSPVQRLSLFLEEILLVEIEQNIVIFIDEVDRVLSQNFSLDDFFGLIRHCVEQRHQNAKYRRLTFALLGVATPHTLIQDHSQTPFNIGKAITLEGFTLTEAEPLMEGLKGKVEHPEVIIQEILNWTGGQPFLTQKLCKLVIQEIEHKNFFEQISPNSPLKGREIIEQIVKLHLVENWEANDEPEHLRTIRDRLLKNGQRTVRLLGLYQQILEQGEIISDYSADQRELQLSGLVVAQQGKLRVYNRIYEQVFNQNWLNKQLNELRPYATAINRWLASNCQDETTLLRGKALQEALTWSLGKNLSDLDYQYLVASQDLAKKVAESALDVLEEASHLLASARQTAKQEILKQCISWHWIPKVILVVTTPILLLRFSGLLQNLEWNLLDQFFRLRSLESPDKRITLVMIDESDLKKIGQWPIPDQLLAQAITHIKKQQPKVIGLDIYRNLPVEPGHHNLENLFRSTPNLFGIEKLVEPKVSPSIILQKRDQIGFSDQVLDSDGRIRRALLSIGLSNQKISYSFAVKLSLYYLKNQGIELEDLDNERVRLGKGIFKRFRDHDGGYIGADSGGYQILINFRGSEENFTTIPFNKVLNNQISPQDYRDRLIIIGTRAESLNDQFFTPYSGDLFGSPQRMSGVTLHANIVSQLLSSALDGRSLLQSWPEWLEWLWILTWAGVGIVISWGGSSSSVMIFRILAAGSGLLGICFVAFLWGWWLPIVPSGFALVGNAVTLLIVRNRERDRCLLQLTLTKLLTSQQNNPTVGRIAIAYLKQSETKENQALIEKKCNF